MFIDDQQIYDLIKQDNGVKEISTGPGLNLKSSPVKYSYLSSSLDDNADFLAGSLSKLY